jgi:hypothetical protein
MGMRKSTTSALLIAVALAGAACQQDADPAATTPGESASTTIAQPATTSTTIPEGEPKVVLSGDEDYPDGFTVPAGEIWAFDPEATTTVTVGANVIVEGRLEMVPASGDIEHVLVFEGVDESAFQGGGMEPIESDVGLWVVGDGQLTIEGEEKTAWSYEYDPAWEGDEVLAAPNSPDDYETFEEVTSTPPANELGYPTELLNLTRNVRIEGTPDGYTHIFLRSEQPQTIRYAAVRYVGPRFGDTDTTGRYGMHFHMAGDGMRGSLVEGVVIRDAGNHAFVPHASHGITFQDTIAYEVSNEAYWWDEPPEPPDDPDYDPINDTNDIVWDRAVAAKVSEGFAGSRFRLGAFFLANGQNLTLTNSVAVAVEGDEETERSGFAWSEATGDVWNFENNIAHNNEANGIFVWQNTSLRHDVGDFTAYFNAAAGVNHGAYGNSYQYSDLTLLENGQAVISHALGEESEGSDAQTWTNVVSEGGILVVEEHETDAEAPVRFVDCDFSSVVVVDEEGGAPSDYEFVRCGLEPEAFDLEEAMSESVFRVQRDDGTAFELSGDGTVTEIEVFYSD